ncbi:hypothetical protein SSTU70S_05420 [Stutzerimonas stutzeri]
MMRIWRWPLVIGLLSLLGLLAGLVSDGVGDWLSWADAEPAGSHRRQGAGRRPADAARRLRRRQGRIRGAVTEGDAAIHPHQPRQRYAARAVLRRPSC